MSDKDLSKPRPDVNLTLLIGTAKRRVIVDLVKLEPSVVRLLHRLEPKIIESFFYRQSVTERVIDLDPQRVLVKLGDLHRSIETPCLDIIAPDISANDEAFAPGRFGDPRNPDNAVKWLTSLAGTLNQSLQRRQKLLDDARASLEKDVDAWLKRYAEKAVDKPDQFVTLFRDENGDPDNFRMDLEKVPYSTDPKRATAIRKHLDALCKASGYADPAAYFRTSIHLKAVADGAKAQIHRASIQRQISMETPIEQSQLVEWVMR